jgi:hypothetical protein
MSVYIACDKCQKRLKIPENVLGRSIKCPSCGAVFKSDATKVLPATPAEAPAHAVTTPKHTAPATHEEDAEIVPARKKAAARDDADSPKPRKKAAVEDEDEDVIPAKKKAVADEDEDEVEMRPARKKAAAAEDDEPMRGKRRRAADYDDEDAEALEMDDEPRKGRRRTPWYVMVPLLLLSFLGVGLAWVWTLLFTALEMDRGVNLSFDSRMWIGIGLGVGITLFCLIFSLIPVRAWLRFLLVFLFLGLGYGGSFLVMHFWKDLGLNSEEKMPGPAQPFPPGLGPQGAPNGRGGGGGIPPPPNQ